MKCISQFPHGKFFWVKRFNYPIALLGITSKWRKIRFPFESSTFYHIILSKPEGIWEFHTSQMHKQYQFIRNKLCGKIAKSGFKFMCLVLLSLPFISHSLFLLKKSHCEMKRYTERTSPRNSSFTLSKSSGKWYNLGNCHFSFITFQFIFWQNATV